MFLKFFHKVINFGWCQNHNKIFNWSETFLLPLLKIWKPCFIFSIHLFPSKYFDPILFHNKEVFLLILQIGLQTVRKLRKSITADCQKKQIPGVGGDLWIFEVVWRAMNFVLRWWWVLRLRSFAWKWMGNIWNSRQSKMIRFSLHNLSYFVRFLFQQQSSHVTKQYEHFL